jgi:hypothetical protein
MTYIEVYNQNGSIHKTFESDKIKAKYTVEFIGEEPFEIPEVKRGEVKIELRDGKDGYLPADRIFVEEDS